MVALYAVCRANQYMYRVRKGMHWLRRGRAREEKGIGVGRATTSRPSRPWR